MCLRKDKILLDEKDFFLQMSGSEGEMDGDNINVVIRVRPLNEKEQKVQSGL